MGIPKAELHCHLDGVLTPAMLRDILASDGQFPISLDTLSRCYPVNNLHTLARWMDIVEPILGEPDMLGYMLGRHIAALIEQDVRYAELILIADPIRAHLTELIDGFHSFREWTTQMESGRIQIEFLLGIRRDKPLAEIEQITLLARRLHQKGLIAGVSLFGPERGNPVERLARFFDDLHEHGLGIEVHAGEWCGPESIWDAIQFGHVDRIGHGTSGFKDPSLIQYLQTNDIHIEMCLTSALLTGSIGSIEEHPIIQARDLGLKFSVNTDDPGPFQCSMNSEFNLLREVFEFDEKDFSEIYQNTLLARFASELRVSVT